MSQDLAGILQVQRWLSGPAGLFISIFLSRYLIFVLAGLVAVLGYLPGRAKFRAFAYEAGWSSSLAFILAYVIGRVVGRERPFLASPLVEQRIPMPLTTHAFPSAHSAIAFSVAMSLALAHPLLGVAAFFLAVLVAIGRVAAGVHYPSDVIAGAILGVLSALCIHWYRLKMLPKIMRRS